MLNKDCNYRFIRWEDLTSDEDYARSFYFMRHCDGCESNHDCEYQRFVERVGLAAIVTYDECSFDELLEIAESLEDLEEEEAREAMIANCEEYAIDARF